MFRGKSRHWSVTASARAAPKEIGIPNKARRQFDPHPCHRPLDPHIALWDWIAKRNSTEVAPLTRRVHIVVHIRIRFVELQ